ncbi:hypothetical protein MIMGU_mgv1a006047mg [Erythranthe guttata]|uniref:RING-type domain-containing protein n=1 Tax=Erythranthe guttata TaxID=4155 RepID=A0A022RUG2_ERYGU|nr:hypothetical protein MIMGU_mgv1a006047mg [Erythranthe guttata]
MPVQKRPRETPTPPSSPPPPPPPLEVDKADDSLQGGDNRNHEQHENASDSDETSYSSDGEKDEFISVKLSEIRKDVQCPICLGIIRKTRTVMECLHRFCRECIDKSMRLGNNECPACRTHCASRRSLRDDPNYDALISALYPDIDKYEEEESAFHEEEKARNKQIQDSIAQTFRRQAEALGKKRPSAKAAAAAATTSDRRQGHNRNLRGRRNQRVVEHHISDDDEEEEDGTNGQDDNSKDSSSSEEHSPELVKLRKYKRSRVSLTSQPSPQANADEGCNNNDEDEDSDKDKESLGASAALVHSRKILGWGRGGARSNTRHGGLNWANGRLSKPNRLSKFVNHLRSLHEDAEFKISLMLVSLHEKIPNLKRPYLCCSHTSSVRHLCQYIAMQTSVEASEIEMLVIKDYHRPKGSSVLNPCHNNELQLLNDDQTLDEINTKFTQRNLVRHYL